MPAAPTWQPSCGLAADDVWTCARDGAVALLPFVAAFGVLAAIRPPSPAAYRAAGPVVRALASTHSVVGIALLTAAVCALLVWRLPPDAAALRRVLRQGGAGALVALVGVLVLPALCGPALPRFVPPEESGRPGLVLGPGAGVVEEALFRLVVLPFTYSALRRRVAQRPAVATAVVLTGLAFALAHEVAPTGPFSRAHFAARWATAGSLLSALLFWPGAPFVAALHATAHLVLPFAFP